MYHQIRGVSSNTFMPVSATTRAGLKPIGPRAGVIYYWLYKYTQQHTAGFTENNWTPHILRPTLATTIQYCISSLKCRNPLRRNQSRS